VGGGGVFDAADVAGVVAGVDDDGAGFDPAALDEFGPTDGCDDDVGVTHHAARSTVLEWQ